MNKYIGKILEGRWEVVKPIHGNSSIRGYELQNVYNQEKMYVNKNRLKLVFEGTLTVSKIRERKVKRTQRRENLKWLD